jgi:2-polyprenyl-3-methyl-5-hydroxy-6-metoxy-1,4-benzoquinol methylase
MNIIKSLFNKNNKQSEDRSNMESQTSKVVFTSETYVDKTPEVTEISESPDSYLREEFTVNVENSKEFQEANADYLYTAPEISGWFSEEEQLLAFRTLLNFYSIQHSILDVGCGRGDLYQLLTQINPNINYKGIDYNENLINLAKTKYGQDKFETAEFLQNEFVPESFDWVVASAVFNQSINANMDTYSRNFIDKMFEVCKLGIAFNLMFKAPEGLSNEELQTLHIHNIGTWCEYLTSKYQKTCMYSDYIDGDVTFFISK